MIRFHLDEHIHPAIATGVRVRGIDVTTAAEAGLLGANDEQHLAFATREQRVIVTHDSDFLVLHANGKPHAGIAFCHHEARSIGEIVAALVLMNECLTADEMQNRVEFI